MYGSIVFFGVFKTGSEKMYVCLAWGANLSMHLYMPGHDCVQPIVVHMIHPSGNYPIACMKTVAYKNHMHMVYPKNCTAHMHVS